MHSFIHLGIEVCDLCEVLRDHHHERLADVRVLKIEQ